MKVYHGSYMAIEEIDLSKAIANKDFGRGFYVTKFRHHAETWAAVMGRRYKAEGVVTEFEYNETAFTRDVCKIKHFDGSAPAPLAGNLRDASGGAEELDPPRHRQEHTAPPELNV